MKSHIYGLKCGKDTADSSSDQQHTPAEHVALGVRNDGCNQRYLHVWPLSGVHSEETPGRMSHQQTTDIKKSSPSTSATCTSDEHSMQERQLNDQSESKRKRRKQSFTLRQDTNPPYSHSVRLNTESSKCCQPHASQSKLADQSTESPSLSSRDAPSQSKPSTPQQNDRLNMSLRCEHCLKVFQSRGSLLRHSKHKHPEQGVHALHRATARIWRDVRCNVTKDAYGFHCNSCDYIVANSDDFCSHNREEHCVTSPFQCALCSKQFNSAASMANHAVAHADTRQHRCCQCGESFKRSSGLYYHTKYKHADQRQFMCDICGKSFVENSKLIRHRKIHDK